MGMLKDLGIFKHSPEILNFEFVVVVSICKTAVVCEDKEELVLGLIEGGVELTTHLLKYFCDY